MKLKLKIFVLLFGFCFALSSLLLASGNRAEESLSKGKRLYADGRYEEAMDSFIDVFVSGNADQISEANEYVNLIHFDRGGVVPPKQVPYDQEIENLHKSGSKAGKSSGGTSGNQQAGIFREVYMTDDLEDIPEPATSEMEADPFGYQQQSEEAKAEETVADSQGEAQEDQNEGEQQTTSEEAVTEVTEEELVTTEDSSFPRGSKSKVRSLQKKAEKQKRKEMIDSLVSKLNAEEDVQVYMRGGRVDAIDINSAALFAGPSISKISSPILDDVYALMILENSPSYVILPEGSYTDDVTLHAVRQAVALNTYLINRGMSPSKMNLNMGLTTQEPPEKFSNLAGISIVFDYDGVSRLKSKLQDKNLPPVLSLAVYPFEEITPSAGEVFVIDFSVMEGSSSIKEWVLQIVSHNADDHYYVVKQLSGDGALNYQTFWNGHKRYFGHLLPLGKYTLVLRAKDIAGRERILKRQLVLKEGPEREDVIIIKTESEVANIEKAKAEANKDKGLDYTQKRLWTKPGKRQVGVVDEEESSQTSSVVSVTQTTQTVSESSTGVADVPQEQETSMEVSSYGSTNNSYETTTSTGEEFDSGEF